MSLKSVIRFFIVLCLVTNSANGQIHLVADKVRRDALAQDARIERMVMVPMRDGVKLASRIYIPANASGPVPTILWRSPYNFSEKMVPNPDYPDANLKFALDAIRHGYAFVMQNERGKFFSEGEWEILGRPRTDGYDTLTWIADQTWSDGKVGTIGCSSTAEWIMGLASTRHPAHVAAVPMGVGAGIGRMGPYYEQGNFYHGGAIQLPMVAWLYGEQNLHRPTFAPSLTRDELIRVSHFYDLAPDMPDVDWQKAFRHLPLRDAIVEAGGSPGVFDDMANRGPDHASWYAGGLYHDNEDFHVPALWVHSWYDLSVAPNIELFKHVRNMASERYIRENQYMIVSPTEHCHTYRLRNPHIVGARNMGNVEFGFDDIVYAFLDYYMKGDRNEFPRNQPTVKYFTMGSNEWQEASEWPPQGAAELKLYLRSSNAANSLMGDGFLASEPPIEAGFDQFTYDPSNPVPSIGGNVCCLGDALTPGSFDQRPVEARGDVLVYTSDVLQSDLEVSGPIAVHLFISSDARDTDFTVKLVDVDPGGVAWNLDESIQRTRYREGYSSEVFMQLGAIYELQIGPLMTSNLFRKDHRIRIEISSSSYPRFDRNLNTGGKNALETAPVIARNTVHHGPGHASYIVLTTVAR